jgi:hypothetical protein
MLIVLSLKQFVERLTMGENGYSTHTRRVQPATKLFVKAGRAYQLCRIEKSIRKFSRSSRIPSEEPAFEHVHLVEST